MKKIDKCLVLSVLIALFLVPPVYGAEGTENVSAASALSTGPVMDDNLIEITFLSDQAGLLSEAEAAQLEAKLIEISTRQLCDVAVVTVDSLNGKTATAYADDFYDENDIGYGSEDDGVLLLLGMEEREWAITTYGLGKTAFTDAGLSYIEEKFLPTLSDGKYAKAFTIFADNCDRFLEQAYTGTPYDTGHMPKGTVSLIWIPVSLAVGFLLAFILGKLLASSLKSVQKQNSAMQYQIPGSLQLHRNTDMLVNTIVTSRPIPKKTETEAGGSSAHSSSSGRNHGGSSGTF